MRTADAAATVTLISPDHILEPDKAAPGKALTPTLKGLDKELSAYGTKRRAARPAGKSLHRR